MPVGSPGRCEYEEIERKGNKQSIEVIYKQTSDVIMFLLMEKYGLRMLNISVANTVESCEGLGS